MSLAEALLPGFVLEMVQGKMTEGEKELAYNLTVIYGLSLLSMIVLYRLLKPIFTPPCAEVSTPSTLPSLASTTALIKARRSVMPKDLSGDRLSKEEVEAVLEAAVWAPTHHKNQPWRFTVLDGPQAIAGYLDRLDAWYSDHKEEIDQQEFTKFLAKLEGSRTSWVNNASHVVVLGMVRQAGENRAAEWEEVTMTLISLIFYLSTTLFLRWLQWHVRFRTCTWLSLQSRAPPVSGRPTPGVRGQGIALSGGSTWGWRTPRTGCWVPSSWAGWSRARFSAARGMTGKRRPDGRNRMKLIVGHQYRPNLITYQY